MAEAVRVALPAVPAVIVILFPLLDVFELRLATLELDVDHVIFELLVDVADIVVVEPLIKEIVDLEMLTPSPEVYSPLFP